ncbi:hypothetical protein EJ02DRAFT_427872 [Clathrospora elynae]|uniref:Uncharacterized protein n=1 Tax=Clathrospora elynae TaxID=706981 RepID=A0A6A5S991_9PLEO|nr:hypothetical protein EJ02DRAFT_427872 [Clathrospora elynae]
MGFHEVPWASLQQEVKQKQIQVNWVPTDQMPADGLTKVLSCPKHKSFVKQLGLEDIRSLITPQENEEAEKGVELSA